MVATESRQVQELKARIDAIEGIQRRNKRAGSHATSGTGSSHATSNPNKMHKGPVRSAVPKPFIKDYNSLAWARKLCIRGVIAQIDSHKQWASDCSYLQGGKCEITFGRNSGKSPVRLLHTGEWDHATKAAVPALTKSQKSDITAMLKKHSVPHHP